MEGKDFEKTASLLTAAVALTSCSTVPIQKPELAEPVPLTEPMPTEGMPSNNPETTDTTNAADILPQPTMIPEPTDKEVDFFHQTDAHEDNHIKKSKYVISITDGQISTEEAEDDGVFNEEILDIFNWKESGMKVEEVKRNLLPKTVEITKPTNIFSVDLSDNGFVMKGIYAFLEKSTVTAGTLEILDEKTIISEKGGSVTLGILPHEGKVKQIQAVILEAIDSDGTKEEFVKIVEDSKTAKEPVVEVSTEKHAIDEEILELTSYIYNPEDLTRVEEYIEFNPTIESILSLKEALDEYPGNNKILLPQYLRETEWYQDMVDKVGEELMEKVLNQNTVIANLEFFRKQYESILENVGYELEKEMRKVQSTNRIGLFVEEDVLYTTLKLNEKKVAFRHPNEHLYFVIAEAIEHGKTMDELLRREE